MQGTLVRSCVSNQLPTLVIGERAGHFDRGVLARQHGGDGHGRVPFPRAGDQNGVEIVALEQPFEVVLAA